jgi:hypothetical protein
MGPEIAKAFEHAQNSRCRYFQNRKLTRMARRNFWELYEEIRFLQTSKEQTDIEGLREHFQPGLVSFREFLEESQRGDRNRTFHDFSNPDSLTW